MNLNAAYAYILCFGPDKLATVAAVALIVFGFVSHGKTVSWQKKDCKFFFELNKVFLAIPGDVDRISTMRVDGTKIKLIRESKNLSKAEFAELAQVTRQAVESWENGNVQSFKTLAKIAEALQVPERILLEAE